MVALATLFGTGVQLQLHVHWSGHVQGRYQHWFAWHQSAAHAETVHDRHGESNASSSSRIHQDMSLPLSHAVKNPGQSISMFQVTREVDVMCLYELRSNSLTKAYPWSHPCIRDAICHKGATAAQVIHLPPSSPCSIQHGFTRHGEQLVPSRMELPMCVLCVALLAPAAVCAVSMTVFDLHEILKMPPIARNRRTHAVDELVDRCIQLCSEPVQQRDLSTGRFILCKTRFF